MLQVVSNYIHCIYVQCSTSTGTLLNDTFAKTIILELQTGKVILHKKNLLKELNAAASECTCAT